VIHALLSTSGAPAKVTVPPLFYGSIRNSAIRRSDRLSMDLLLNPEPVRRRCAK